MSMTAAVDFATCPEAIKPTFHFRWTEGHEIYQPILKAGNLIIFNGATTHGGLPRKGKTERRCILHRYTPKYLYYDNGYYETSLPEWVSELTEAQQAVLESPYIFNRPLIEEDGITVVRPQREGE